MLWDSIYCCTEEPAIFRAVRECRNAKQTFAAYLLIPDKELQKFKGIGIEKLAEYFGVPQEKVELRITLFNVDM